MPDNVDKGSPKRIVFSELQKRTSWFIRLRWLVSPAIILGVLVAANMGFEFNQLALLLIAVLIFSYNVAFRLIQRQIEQSKEEEKAVKYFTYFQVGFDYLAMFLLTHFTGGVVSPFIIFFVFHIIFASILLLPPWAYAFAALSSAGMTLISVLEYNGWLTRHPIVFNGAEFALTGQPGHMFVKLLFFTAAAFIAAFTTTDIMHMLRMRIISLDRSHAAIGLLNDKLNSLYRTIKMIGSKQQLKHVLEPVCDDLTRMMNVRALSVKLLNESGKLLKYAAAFGLPESLVMKNSIILDRSPLNHKIIEGEPFVTGAISQQEMFQFGEDLEVAGIKSVLFVPLKVEGKVIGILGGYCVETNRFLPKDVDFFQQAADLVAIAIENARTYESIEKLMQERTRFMMHVAHNLRAPLDATISTLNVLRNGYLGDLKDEQQEYLRRIERRAWTMRSMINELLVLARCRSQARKFEKKPVDLKLLAGRIERSFVDDAGRKEIEYRVSVADDIPKIMGDFEMLEQMLENLVSNAIKYTKVGGVHVDFAVGRDEKVWIKVSDTGIGIPEKDLSALFTDFYRAENAKALDEIGTGLGLAIVKETVDKHKGAINIESELMKGTVFTVTLPIRILDKGSQEFI